MPFKNQLKAGVILSYLSLFLGNGIALFYTPVMLRLMGQSEYGLYSFVSSFVGYLGLMDLGFGATYVRFYTQFKHSKSEEEVSRLNGMFLLIFGVISLLTLFCGGVMVAFSDQIFGGKLSLEELALSKKLLAILILETVVIFAGKIFELFITANERFIFLKGLGIIRNVINPMIMLPLLLMGYRSYAMVLLSFSIALIYNLLCLWYSYRELCFKATIGKVDRKLSRSVLEVSIFVFIGGIVDQLNWNVGKYVLGKCRGAVAVAVFGIASQLAYYYRMFASSVSSVFIPRVNKIVATGDSNRELTDLLIRVGRFQFMILSLIGTGFIFFGQQFCILWAGEDYATAYPMTLCMMLPLTIPLIQNLGPYILIARKRHKARSVIYLIIAVLNLGVCIPFCLWLGGLGCAIATGFSLFLGNGLFINWYYGHIGLEMKRFWRNIISLGIKSLTIPCICGISYLLLQINTSWMTFAIGGLCYALVFCLSMFFFGCNTEERKMATDWIIKRTKH